MDSQPVGILTSAVTGGLAGAALSIITQWISRWWLRPRLEILFANEEPGCRIDTNVAGGTDPVLRFIRLKVKNSGRSTALRRLIPLSQVALYVVWWPRTPPHAAAVARALGGTGAIAN